MLLGPISAEDPELADARPPVVANASMSMMADAKSSRLGWGATLTKQPCFRNRLIHSRKSLAPYPAKISLQMRRRSPTSSQSSLSSGTRSRFNVLATRPAVTKVRLHASNSL